MVVFLIRTLLSFLANGIGLLVAAAVLDDFEINDVSFIVATLIFTLSTVILGPFIANLARKNAQFLLGGIALVTTLVGLIITVLISDGISINSLGAWVAATVIVWLFSMLANVVLPLFMFKKTLDNRKKDD